MRKIDLFTKTNRYCDSSVFESSIPINKKNLKVYTNRLDFGRANEKLYQQFIQLLINEEKSIGYELNLNLKKYSDFNKYFKFLKSVYNEPKYYFVKDGKMLEHFKVNVPRKTIVASNCNNLDELIKKYSVREISALTRIFEDSGWRKLEFEFIEKLSAKDYDARKVTYFTFDSTKFTEVPNFTKMVWDDKICGSVFGFSYIDSFRTEVPFLRMASEFLHFYYEFKIFGEYMNYIVSENQLERFTLFLKNEMEPNDIFDPHALSEAIAWKLATVKLFEVFPTLSDIWNKKELKIFSNKEYILSNNIIDYIRALSSSKFPNICTVSSIIIRYEILNLDYTYFSSDLSILSSLDKEVISIKKLKRRESEYERTKIGDFSWAIRKWKNNNY